MLYNVLQYLENSAEKFPDKIALEDDKSKITYAEYKEMAMQIGSYIIHHKNSPTYSKLAQPIAVLIDRNINSILAFMGIVYSGNFYIPIDATLPEDRIKLIFNTLNPIMLIDAREHADQSFDATLIDEILEAHEFEADAINKVRRYSIDTDPLYAIFTSGSTGIPKGVVVSHKSVIDLAETFYDTFSFDDSLIFGNQAPFDFDVSVKDIYNALKCSGTVQILPKKLFKMPKLLVDYLREKNVNALIWAVSALRIVADFRTFDAASSIKLRYVMFSGEVMPMRVLNYWINKIPEARYTNLYGPTEITCNCTYYDVIHKYKDDEILPIGKAFINSRIELYDTDKKPITEPDKIGEICVMGSCLALGYWNEKIKTREAFVQNPTISAYESKMYMTGDIGYYDADGNIVFISRKDYQIKHMGHRIELGDIEVALNAIPFLSISCCLFDKEKEKIVCFYQSDRECKTEIVTELSKKLPKYMWPNIYIHYTKLPVNKNGKIDRVLLGESLK